VVNRASKACCPAPKCPVVLEEGPDGAIIDVLNNHLGLHGLCLDEEYKTDLQARIMFIRDKIHMTDPFIHVPLEKCSSL